MNRQLRFGPLLILVGLAGLPLACDYSDQSRSAPKRVIAGQLPVSNMPKGVSNTPTVAASIVKRPIQPDTPDQKEKREAILVNVLRLIETAGTTPGGENFGIATQNLNQYFEQGTTPTDYVMNPEARRFLLASVDEAKLKDIESQKFEKIDARHIEDCMLYHAIATRIAGDGDDLTRVRRIFDWLIRHVQVVPAQSLAGAGMQQAQARPYDVLLRGMATESSAGFWTERGWLFMALCRQVGVDVGLISYVPRLPPQLLSNQPEQPDPEQPAVWACAALIDGKAYLFDHRLGIAIPRADGTGVATLEEAMNDPQVLAQLDLPGQSLYGTTRTDLISSTSKLSVLLDSSRGYFSPKMKLLQSRLAGKNRTILFRDPAEQRDQFNQVIGPRLKNVLLWQLPMIVETYLFTNPQFVTSTQFALRLFDGRLPLLYARMAQLKGDIPEAIRQYVALRFATGALMRDRVTVIVPPLQRELDVYSTYFLALCHLEQKNASLAESFFKQTLDRTPAPAPNREPCFMFRWGANTNLGYLQLEKGNLPLATRYLSQPDVILSPSWQVHGNLWLAREALWRTPTSLVSDPLPPAPARQDAGAEAAAMR